MMIRLSNKINANNCVTCRNRRPWKQTVTDIEAQLRSHGVTWPNFTIMHGNDLTCAEALDSAGKKNVGLYVVATDAQGNEDRSADVFARKDPHYVGVKAAIDGRAFQKTSDDEEALDEAPVASTAGRAPPKPVRPPEGHYSINKARRMVGKTVASVDVGHRRTIPDVHEGELIVIRFTDGTSLSIDTGSNSAQLLSRAKAGDFHTDFILEWFE